MAIYMKRKIARFVIPVLLLEAGAAHSVDTLTILHNLTGSDGQFPHGPLVQGRDGNLYGTTSPAGVLPAKAFKISPSGLYQTIHSFSASPGSPLPNPSALVRGHDGNFYGITTNGNLPGGSIFKLSPAGTLNVLHRFGSIPNDGYSIDNGILRPVPPVQTPDGTIYGTTTSGGHNGAGIVYKITPSGSYSILHHFALSVNDGSNPSASLIVGNDGQLYGTSTLGGLPSASSGTVFRITTAGVVNVLHGFDAITDGGHQPQAPLVKGTDGNFYGTTFGRGDLDQQGNVFKIAPSGVYTNLHNHDFFNDVSDGAYPSAGLVQASNGLFYGATSRGGLAPGLLANDAGVIFQVTNLGLYDVSHIFDKTLDGGRPVYGLVQHSNGTLYGTTQLSKTSLTPPGNGSIFKLDVGARPFVFAQPNSGRAGNITRLFGDFSGATGVTFNGIPAPISGTDNFFRFATIPAGPATGIIKIKTPTGSINGLVNFLVQPVFSAFSPTAGAIGSNVTLTGASLSQTTAITFSSGKKALFIVNSDSQLTAIVPAGAVSGKIVITTKGGVASSAANFTVLP